MGLYQDGTGGIRAVSGSFVPELPVVRASAPGVVQMHSRGTLKGVVFTKGPTSSRQSSSCPLFVEVWAKLKCTKAFVHFPAHANYVVPPIFKCTKAFVGRCIVWISLACLGPSEHVCGSFSRVTNTRSSRIKLCGTANKLVRYGK